MPRKPSKKRGNLKPKHRATREDAEVGGRVRALRLERDMSQTVLGKRLGVTFQQVQKYEKGVNRIGAGRLQSLSEIFAVPVSAFFPERKRSSEYKPTLFELANSSDAVALLRAYASLSNRRLRRNLVQVANAMLRASQDKIR